MGAWCSKECLFYVNGILLNTTYHSYFQSSSINATGKVLIGGDGSEINAELKQLRVWNSIRTQSEINNSIFQNNSLSIHYINTSNESFIFNGQLATTYNLNFRNIILEFLF